jgi:hypothetical protein
LLELELELELESESSVVPYIFPYVGLKLHFAVLSRESSPPFLEAPSVFDLAQVNTVLEDASSNRSEILPVVFNSMIPQQTTLLHLSSTVQDVNSKKKLREALSKFMDTSNWQHMEYFTSQPNK